MYDKNLIVAFSHLVESLLGVSHYRIIVQE